MTGTVTVTRAADGSLTWEWDSPDATEAVVARPVLDEMVGGTVEAVA